MIVLVIFFLFILLWHSLKYCRLVKIPVFCLIRCATTALPNTAGRIEFLKDGDTVGALMTNYMRDWLVIHLGNIVTCSCLGHHGTCQWTLIFCVNNAFLMGRWHRNCRFNARGTTILLQQVVLMLFISITLVVEGATLGLASTWGKYTRVDVRSCLVRFLKVWVNKVTRDWSLLTLKTDCVWRNTRKSAHIYVRYRCFIRLLIGLMKNFIDCGGSNSSII